MPSLYCSCCKSSHLMSCFPDLKRVGFQGFFVSDFLFRLKFFVINAFAVNRDYFLRTLMNFKL